MIHALIQSYPGKGDTGKGASLDVRWFLPLRHYRQRLETQNIVDMVRQRYLSRLPDLPLWVETRDLLLSEDTNLFENSTQSGFVVWSAEDGLGSVVGEPEPHALAMAAEDVPELLALSSPVRL